MIRSSKVRHLFGTVANKDNCYEGFRPTNCAFDGTFCAANAKFIAVCVEVGGAGAFSVVPIGETGRQDVNLPKVSAHEKYILDMAWNPYNDNMLATCSEDGSIKIWEIPEGGLVTNWEDDKALLALEYHECRCVGLAWHPFANNVLLSVSEDPTICIWNLDDGVIEVELEGHPDIIWSAAWTMDGTKIITSCKDKKLRVFNARSGKLLKEEFGHQGSKAQRAVSIKNNRFFTTGFSKMSERQYAVWDENLKQLNLAELDTANGTLIPYYDADLNIVYLAARGDSVIRYYELDSAEPYFHYIDTFQSNITTRGLAMLPKRDVNVNNCEVARFYRMESDKSAKIHPISFVIPRKSDLYQSDIYPDTIGPNAALEASDWFGGKDATPLKISLEAKSVSTTNPAKSGGLKGINQVKSGGLKGLKAKAAHTVPSVTQAVSESPSGPVSREDFTKLIERVTQLEHQLKELTVLQNSPQNSI